MNIGHICRSHLRHGEKGIADVHSEQSQLVIVRNVRIIVPSFVVHVEDREQAIAKAAACGTEQISSLRKPSELTRDIAASPIPHWNRRISYLFWSPRSDHLRSQMHSFCHVDSRRIL